MVNVLMMPSALSRSFCSGKAIWWASEERCHGLLNSVTLQNTDGHYCNQHCLGCGLLLSHCGSWRRRSAFSPYTLNISRFHFPATLLRRLMSHATREDSGFFAKKNVSFTIETGEHQFCREQIVSSCTFWDKNQDFINVPVPILLKPKYFKAAYGTLTLNWIRKRNVPLQILQNRGGI